MASTSKQKIVLVEFTQAAPPKMLFFILIVKNEAELLSLVSCGPIKSFCDACLCRGSFAVLVTISACEFD